MAFSQTVTEDVISGHCIAGILVSISIGREDDETADSAGYFGPRSIVRRADKSKIGTALRGRHEVRLTLRIDSRCQCITRAVD
ncbi:hypothetical protein A2J03_23030 [Rhodococcus sp. EPR-157]|jgi:hypothetical protein|nr:hypothetical protein A2J03_23030 [Rhodococcus sp. EPR-157]